MKEKKPISVLRTTSIWIGFGTLAIFLLGGFDGIASPLIISCLFWAALHEAILGKTHKVAMFHFTAAFWTGCLTALPDTFRFHDWSTEWSFIIGPAIYQFVREGMEFVKPSKFNLEED